MAVDLRLPHEAYPAARAMRRTIHAHVGPTNSGKTHAAIEALRSAASGVYCGPLRLLAFEIYDRLGSNGLPCTLRTGQETIEERGAEHTSCTVEMCAVHRPVDVGVLDEIQMLSHPERGWAWSRALLGLPARELHVCGSADALPLLRSLVDACDDELVVHEYERLTPLVPADRSLRGDLRLVRPGDCVVAFSRQKIFELKQRVEDATGLQCGVVYGSLPPETRREQARLFNDPAAPEEVLVASDAVGMGLNLNVQRIIFSAAHKFDGETTRPLEPTEVKQIAGRAGRYRSRYDAGEVTCIHEHDMAYVRGALAAPLEPLAAAGLAPTFEQLDLFDRTNRHGRPSPSCSAFEDSASTSRFCCTLEPMVRAAEALEAAPHLTLAQRHLLCQTPMDARDPLHATMFRHWGKDLQRDRDGGVRLRYAPPTRAPASHVEMKALESYFRTLDGYLWLAQRLPDAFLQEERAREYRATCQELIEGALQDPPEQTTTASGWAAAAGDEQNGRRARGGGGGSAHRAAAAAAAAAERARRARAAEEGSREASPSADSTTAVRADR